MTSDYSEKEAPRLTQELPSSKHPPLPGVSNTLIALMLLGSAFIGNAEGQYSFPDSSDDLHKMIKYGGWQRYPGASCEEYQSAFAQAAGISTRFSCAVDVQTSPGTGGTASTSFRAAAYIEDGINPMVEAKTKSSLSCDYCFGSPKCYVHILWPYKVDCPDIGPDCVVDPDKEYPLYVQYFSDCEASGQNETFVGQVALYQRDQHAGYRTGTMLARAYWWEKHRSDGQNTSIEYSARIYSHLYGEKDGQDFGVLEAKVQGAHVKDLWLEVWAAATSNVHWERNRTSSARILVDPYLYIDPASPLAEEYQVFAHENYTSSEWVPHVHVPIDYEVVDYDWDG
jgi:hypothetical protein